MNKLIETPFNISKEEQIKELVKRVPPIVNVDIVLVKKDEINNSMKFLIAHRNPKHLPEKMEMIPRWQFPGSRMKFTETPQETAHRVLKNELPGVKANLKKLITVISDKGYDYRSNGVSILYLFEYIEGEPKVNNQLNDFIWGTSEDIKNIEGVYVHDLIVLKEVESIVKTMNVSQDELIVEVDKNNQEIGYEIKRILHSDNKRYHRAAHIIIFNTRGDVILHQRGFNKIICPGLWDMFGGHQVYGHTIEQTAKQELLEELGIETNLKFHRSGLYQDENQSEFYHVFYGISDGPYGFDRNEVEQINSFDCQKLLDGEYDNEYKFVEPFAKMYVKELSFVWRNLK